MASPRVFVFAAFFIALSFFSIDVALATRKLLATTLPAFPDVQFPTLPLGGFDIPNLPEYPEYRLPPPIISFPDIPVDGGNIPAFPIFSPPAPISTSTP
ncbi:hypothetical protein CJ030_MR6G018048 [Morella rubra]|uniref:Uncharacterized protein n=1 Tax=Morella rubra TaxID=262757 RepID=A0A6A1VDX6_9ROSI|nr:hypothetical protein CJ030_MR6G018048 [Morella rubra]